MKERSENDEEYFLGLLNEEYFEHEQIRQINL